MEDSDSKGVVIGSAATRIMLTPAQVHPEYGVPITITVSAGPFRGELHDRLFIRSLAAFDRQLAAIHASLAGSASLGSLDSALNFSLVGNGKGGIAGTATVLAVEFYPAIRLEFGIAFDQSYIPQIRSDIRRHFLLPFGDITTA